MTVTVFNIHSPAAPAGIIQLPTGALLMLNAVIIVIIIIAAVWFHRSAVKGTGLPNRIVQRIYYQIGSLEKNQKSGRRYSSAAEVMAGESDSLLGPIIRLIAPGQLGWFSSRFPTDKAALHDYLSWYDSLFTPYLAQPDLRLLEVGVKKGGSLVLWRELFGPDAFIYGIDVNPDVPKFSRDAHMKVLILDSTCAGDASAALGTISFDIIIDDGLHDPKAQRRTFEALYPHLKPSGIYIIEDVYRFDTAEYAGVEWRCCPDQSGQWLVAFFPQDSLARSTAVWKEGLDIWPGETSQQGCLESCRQ